MHPITDNWPAPAPILAIELQLTDPRAIEGVDCGKARTVVKISVCGRRGSVVGRDEKEVDPLTIMFHEEHVS